MAENAEYDKGYSDGESSCLADFVAAFDELTDIEVEGAWQAAEAVKAALRSTRADALTDAVSAVWAVKDRRGVVSGDIVDICRDIALAIEALAKAP